MGEILNGGGFVLDTPEEIEVFRLLSAWQGLAMEALHNVRMTRSVNCYVWVKNRTGLKGNKINVLRQYEDLLVKAGILKVADRKTETK